MSSSNPPHSFKKEGLRPEDIAPKPDDVSHEPKKVSPAEVQKETPSASGKYKVIVGKAIHSGTGGSYSESALGDEILLTEEDAKSLLAQGAIEKV